MEEAKPREREKSYGALNPFSASHAYSQGGGGGKGEGGSQPVFHRRWPLKVGSKLEEEEEEEGSGSGAVFRTLLPKTHKKRGGGKISLLFFRSIFGTYEAYLTFSFLPLSPSKRKRKWHFQTRFHFLPPLATVENYLLCSRHTRSFFWLVRWEKIKKEGKGRVGGTISRRWRI